MPNQGVSILIILYKKSQHGCIRWALRELRALHEHLTCNHAMISPAAGLRILFFYYIVKEADFQYANLI